MKHRTLINGRLPGILALLLARPALLPADTATLTVAADTFITGGAPDNNAGGHPWFTVGTDGPFGGNAVRRGLVRFNLSSIPAGAVVTSAVLRLTVTRVPATGAVNSNFDLYRLLASWGEGTNIGNAGSPAMAGQATWNARLFGSASWTVPGAASDAAATASASAAVGATLGQVVAWSGAGLVNDVQLWVNTPAQNFGWLLMSQAEGSSRSVRGFAARESGVSMGTLEVGYAPPGGNVLPAVSIFNPTNGGTFVAGTPLTIQATASDPDGTVTQVEFFAGGTSLGIDATGPDYSVTTTLYTGTHVLTAVATDNAGDTNVSASVTNTGITVPITDPIAERVPKGDITIELQTIADGMASPLGMAVPDDGSGRMFVNDQDGRVWIVTAAGRSPTPLLDLRGRLVLLGAYDERGLLGLAVHPNFAANPLIYTYTSESNSGAADFQNGLGAGNNHQSVITEWRISAGNSNLVDLGSRREVLRIDQPQGNHNGGSMHFGPDGLLYITLGDGGAANDAGNGHVAGGNAQDINRIWGKLIRLDVDGTTSANGQYAIPASNPFVGVDGLDEVYAYGLRNAFAFSFDRVTGQLYLADVGQNRVEEINLITKGGNYGWNLREGAFWFDGAGSIVTAPVRPPPSGLIDPIAMYDHDDGLAVIGGYVYRGAAIPALAGRYVFGDWGTFTSPSGRLFYLDATNGVKELRIGHDDRSLRLWLKGFGEGADGELYVFASRWLGPSGNTGRMLKIVPVPDPISVSGIAPTNGANVALAWTGGAGPFALQQKAALTDQTWVNRALTAPRNAAVSQDNPAGFFRLKEAGKEPPMPFSAWLTGAAERPTNNSPATGFGLFALDGNTLTFSIAYRGLTATATAAHIHGPVDTSTNAPVLIDLGPYNGGAWGTTGTLSGVVVLSDLHKSYLLAGKTYVNVHNVNFPGGEIRGQLAPVNFQVALNGANERPTPVATPATGLGNFALVGNQLALNLTYRNLLGSANAAHIHGPAGVNDSVGPLVDLGPFNGGAWSASGSLSGTATLTPAQLAAVVDGRTYVNVHSTVHGGGEIRGQLVPHVTGTPLTAWLSGLAEKPTPLSNSATGAATFSLEASKLTLNLVYGGLSGPATAAHIHGPTNTTGNAAVLVDLAPLNGGAFGASGTLSGSLNLTAAQRDAVLNGQTYVNFHTTANPAGEMRGQIAPVVMTATLSGNNERNTPVLTPGLGTGVFALVRDQLALVVAYGGLLSPATMSHIHGPAGLTANAGVLVDLAPFNGGVFGSSGALSGVASLTVSNLLSVIDGSTYVNLHTTNNPSGEIRGQILR